MRPRGRAGLVLALVLGAWLGSAPALAGGVAPAEANADQKTRAQAAFDQGSKLFLAKRYPDARRAFQNSYDIVASPASMFMIGSTYRNEGLYALAYESFDRAEREAKPLSSEDRYAKIAAESARAREAVKIHIGLLTLHVRHAPDDTKVTVGKRDVAREDWDRPFAVPAGPNLAQASASGKKVAKWVGVAKGGSAAVDLDLGASGATAPEPAAAAPPPAPPAAAAEPTPPPAPPPAAAAPPPQRASPAPPAHGGDGSTSHTSLVPFAVAGAIVGVAGFGVFTVAGLMNRSTFSKLEDECPSGACSETQLQEADAGRRQQLIANVGFVVGCVGVATFATLLVVDAAGSSGSKRSGSQGPVKPSASLVAGPSAVALRGRF